MIAIDRNAEALATLNGCTTEVLDLLDPAAIAGFGERTGAVDVLFNCAGYVDAGICWRPRTRAIACPST